MTERKLQLLIAVVALLVAALSARPFAGGWNDGSRLATVESLVDHGTWAIDRSIFVEVPKESSPYAPGDELLRERGTLDKMLIGGRYYSDKSPLPALLVAGVYKTLQLLFGLNVREQPQAFCYWLTLLTSGTSFVAALLFFRRVQLLVNSPQLLLLFAFGFSTVALAYARHVNNHILLLAVLTALLARLLTPSRAPLLVGTLAGAAYTIDLGVGPPLLLCTFALVLYRSGMRGGLLAAAGALPWLALHHWLNYRLGGTWAPANSVAEYLLWPGSPFHAENLTTGWADRPLWKLPVYALDLLFGKRGFVGHNPALYLAIPGAVWLLVRGRRLPELPELLWACCVCGAVWLVYAAGSTNLSGLAASIRWFVPLLAPAFFVLALLLRDAPRYRAELVLLTVFGTAQALVMWWYGPWMKHMIPGYWFYQAALLVTFLVWWRLRGSRR